MLFRVWILGFSLFFCLLSGCNGNAEDEHENDIDWMVENSAQPSQNQNIVEKGGVDEETEKLR